MAQVYNRSHQCLKAIVLKFANKLAHQAIVTGHSV